MKKDVLIYFDLITSLKTKGQVNDFSLEIDTLLSALFKSSKMALDKAIASISTNSAKKIMDIFSKNKLDSADREMIRDFLDTLKDLIKKFKVISLTLAFDPSPKTIEKIHEYVSDNIGIGYIFDIGIDESLMGGAIISFNGKYCDFTLKKNLEETFINKREEILSQN